MPGLFRKPERVRGHIVPRRRFTVWAALYFVAFIVLPVLAIGIALDFLVYVGIDKTFATCLSVFCWAG